MAGNKVEVSDGRRLRQRSSSVDAEEWPEMSTGLEVLSLVGGGGAQEVVWESRHRCDVRRRAASNDWDAQAGEVEDETRPDQTASRGVGEMAIGGDREK
ncbi:hypothetical protein U1Q18_035704 [Sarracenia purpurea var. burkii]